MPEIDDPAESTGVARASVMPAWKGVVLIVVTVMLIVLVIVNTGDGDPQGWGLIGYLTAMLLNSAATPPTLPGLARRTRALRSAAGVAAFISAGILFGFRTRGLDVVLGVVMTLFGILLVLPVLFPQVATRFPRWFAPRR